jgi:hypothetical protein
VLFLPRAARQRTAISPTLALAIALAALVGCGGSSDNGVASKSASEILAAARNAVASARSVHVESEAAQGPLTLKQNLDLARNGGHAHISGLGIDFEVIRTGNTLYIKGSPVFYQRLGITPTRVPKGAWIKTPASSRQFAQLAAFTDLKSEVNRLISSTGPITKGATTTRNGQKTIELKNSGRLYTGALYIATTGDPYPIQTSKTGRETGHTTLTNWNRPVSLSAPSKTISIG